LEAYEGSLYMHFCSDDFATFRNFLSDIYNSCRVMVWIQHRLSGYQL